MGRMKDFVIANEGSEDMFLSDADSDDIFTGDDTDDEVDLYAPVDYRDIAKVLERIFAVVEKYPDGGESAWYYFLNDWDRRFVLNIYDMWVTTGKAPLSLKQEVKARVILRKMMTPSTHSEG